jgi:hypothetical protein
MALGREWMDDWVGAGVQGSVHPEVIGQYHTSHFNMTQSNALQRKAKQDLLLGKLDNAFGIDTIVTKRGHDHFPDGRQGLFPLCRLEDARSKEVELSGGGNLFLA